MGGLKTQAHLQDPVIHDLLGQLRRQLHIHIVSLHPAASSAGKRYAGEQISPVAELLQEPDSPPGACAPLPFRFFQMVKLLQHSHGKHHLVVLKALGRVGCLDQDIRIKHIDLYHRVSPFRIIFYLQYIVLSFFQNQDPVKST